MNELDKLIKELIKQNGGTRQQYLHLLNSVANHETGGTNDPAQKQIGGGPGRGKYQFGLNPNGGGITAAKRLKRYYKDNNKPIPEWLEKTTKQNNLDASTLSSEQQDLLFLGNMKGHPKANLGKVMSGEESVPEFWANYHWAGPKRQRATRLKSFNSTYKEQEPEEQNLSGSIDPLKMHSSREEDPNYTPPKDYSIKSRDDFKGNWLSYLGAGAQRTDRAQLRDLYNYYGGLPLKDNILQKSKYSPTNSKDENAKYISITDPRFTKKMIQQYNRVFVDNDIKNYENSDAQDYRGDTKINDNTYKVSGYDGANGGNKVDVDADIGRYFISKGEDENGKYLSYYDVFNTGQSGTKETSEFIGATKPFEIYDRIYEKDFDSIQNQKALGGNLNKALYGGDFNSFNVGGSHESNPNGGIPLGTGSNGKPNTVEQGETSYNFKDQGKYIFSNRIGSNGIVQTSNMNTDQFALGGNPIKGDPPTQQKDTVGKGIRAPLNLEDLKNKKLVKQSQEYYNPKVEENITSGDWKQDLLYKNQWLMDTPIVGDFIKDKAKYIATNSGGTPVLDKDRLSQLSDPELEDSLSKKYSGMWQKGDPKNEDVISHKNNLIDRYFSEKNDLPKSTYKPTSDFMEFLPSVSIKGDFESKYNSDESPFKETFKNAVGDAANGDDKVFQKFLKDKKTVYRELSDHSDLSNMLNVDLGGHKVGMAWDKDKGLPYISIADAWDFSPDSYTDKWASKYDDDKEAEEDRQLKKIQSSLMHKAGNPFKIYDRFYFNPETKEYISDKEIAGYKKTKKK